MTPYGRNGVCGCFPPDFFATRGMVGAVVDVRGTGGSGGNLEGNFFSPREARDGYDAGRVPRHAAVLDRQGRDGGRLVRRHHPVPGRRAAAAAPGGDHAGGRDQRPLPRRLRPRRHPEPVLRRPVHRRPGRARRGGREHRPVRCSQETLAGEARPVAAGHDRVRLPRAARTTTPFYRDRSPIYRADDDQGAGADHRRLARRPAARRARDVPARSRGAQGVETRLYMDPCTHKGCGAPFAPLTDPPGPRRRRRARRSSSSHKHLRGARDARTGRRSSTTSRARTSTLDATELAAARTGERQLAQASCALGRRPSGDASYVTNPPPGFSMAFDQYGTVAATPVRADRPAARGAAGADLPHRRRSTQPLDARRPDRAAPGRASTATDTDWYAKLADVAPDGSESIITEGALRASHRALDPRQEHARRGRTTPHTDPQPIEPGRFYDYDVEIWPTAYRLARRPPAAAAADLDRPADPPAGLDRLRPRPPGGRARST